MMAMRLLFALQLLSAPVVRGDGGATGDGGAVEVTCEDPNGNRIQCPSGDNCVGKDGKPKKCPGTGQGPQTAPMTNAAMEPVQQMPMAMEQPQQMPMAMEQMPGDMAYNTP